MENKIKNTIQNKAGIEELNLMEIVFDLKEKQKVDEKFSIIKKAIQENGFENTALIYSISETSTSGGNIGWVSENSINKKILNELKKINVSDITNPLVIPGGYLVLRLNEKRITKRNIQVDEELQKIIQKKTNEQLNQFSNIFLNKIKKDIVINEL